MSLLVFFIIMCTTTCPITASQEDVQLLLNGLQDVLNFMEAHYNEINFDGLLGVVIAECK